MSRTTVIIGALTGVLMITLVASIAAAKAIDVQWMPRSQCGDQDI